MGFPLRSVPYLPRLRGPRSDPRQVPLSAVPGCVLRALRGAALTAISVIITGADGSAFAESYRGLWVWAQHHGLSGFWAAAFPLQVDTGVEVGLHGVDDRLDEVGLLSSRSASKAHSGVATTSAAPSSRDAWIPLDEPSQSLKPPPAAR
jgi:hypothetical protein